LPHLPEALDLAPAHQAGGLKTNRLAFEHFVAYRGELEAPPTALLFDPRTSGRL